MILPAPPAQAQARETGKQAEVYSDNGEIKPVQARGTRKVRVGFFNFDGYHMVDEYGRRSGYGYEYLQYLARYANFSYEYVGYDKSWSEMQEMLENGEIDLLTSAQKTEERLKKFDFSEQSIGNSESILTVKAGDSRYMTDNYPELDGIRVGLLEDNSRNQGLERFAAENDFTYIPVYYKDSSELEQELQRGKDIDAILTSNLRRIKNEWVVASFDVTPFYVAVKKGNTELMEQIDDANRKLLSDYPNLSATLHSRYYSARNGDEIAYTASERRYIEERRNRDDPVRVTINSGREPVSYYVNGEARGIIPEIARTVMERTGLPYEFVETAPAVDARGLVKEDRASVRFDGASDFNDAENYGFRVTDPYLQLTLSAVTLKNFCGEPESVAVIMNSDVVEEYVEKTFDEADIFRYDSAEECLEAVLRGKQDAAFFQTYIAQRFVNGDVRNRLKEQLVPGYLMSFAVAAGQGDPALFSILNKAVSSLKSEEIDHIVYEQTSYLARRDSLLSYLYDHPVAWLAVLAGVAGFVIVLLLYIFRRKNLRLEQEKTREFERFISYVCKANDSVIEIDAGRNLRLSYQVEDGKVSCREKTLEPEDREFVAICPEDMENIRPLIREETIRTLIEHGAEEYFECRVITEEGRAEGEVKACQWFSFTLQGVPQDEQKEGSLMIFIKNIDQAKREEEEKRQALQDALISARAAGDAKGEFMSRMSHEIRTPLNAIIGYLTIARSNLANRAKAEMCLEKSEFAAHHLLNIINDVLDISAIESGKMKIAHEEFNIRLLLSGLTSIFHAQAREKNVKFRVRLDELTQENLTGDQMRVNQILMNLLSNAIKFTPSGGQVTLMISQKALAEDRVYLQFEVADTGIGMSEEYKDRLFQPFEQQDASTAQRFGGTGLGLSITRNLTAMMGGTISVKTRQGVGTTFTVNLSFDIAHHSEECGSGIYDFSKLKVLVLYDESSDYAYIQTLLDRIGVIYDLALNIEEALCKLAQSKDSGEEYDLCLMDWDIPGIDGRATAERLRKAGTPEKPAIVAVAYEDPGFAEEETPLERVVLKPIFQSSLFDVLSNICQRYIRPEKCGAGEDGVDLSGARILLVEDNEMNMEIAREILTSYGLVIDAAENGKRAVELFENSEEGFYQAILMDIQMPVMNGYEASARIRAGKHPQAAAIPIIALTADAFAEDINHALAAGMDDHISKPIDFPQLREVLSKYIE